MSTITPILAGSTSASVVSSSATATAAAVTTTAATSNAATAAATASATTVATATTTPSSTVAPTPATPTVIGPLPCSKTITLTFVPDWSQEDIKSPLRAASLCVLLGPANTEPHQALWAFEFNLFATDKVSSAVKLPSAVKNKDEEPIGKGQRALLWYDGKPWPKYKNCIVLSKCRLPANDELKTQSIVLRTHGEERDPNALIWVRKPAGPKRRKDLSYLKVVAGHHYYLNITFAAGSTIAQLVGSQAWRPIISLYAKRQEKGVDKIIYFRSFTNFTTNWAVGIEPNPSGVSTTSVIEVPAPPPKAPEPTPGNVYDAMVSTSTTAAVAAVTNAAASNHILPAIASSSQKLVLNDLPTNDLDLVFVIDATGSMLSVIELVKRNVEEIVNKIKAFQICKTLRFALVAYRDHDPSYQWVTQQTVNFTTDVKEILEGLKNLDVKNGCDTLEAVTDGLAVVSRMPWRPDAAKCVVLMGDAPPHGVDAPVHFKSSKDGHLAKNDRYPEGCPCGERWKVQVSNLRESGIVVHTVGCENYSATHTHTLPQLIATFQHVAKETRGQYFSIKNELQLRQLPLLITGIAKRELVQTGIARKVLSIIKDEKVSKELLTQKNEEYRASLLLAKLIMNKVQVGIVNDEGELETRNITLMDFCGLIPELRKMDPWIATEMFPTWTGPYGNRSGLFAKSNVKDQKEQERVPLTSVKVDVEIQQGLEQQGAVSEVTVEQTYENTSKEMMDVIYKFPIDSTAAVTGFVAKIDEKTIVAKCMENKKAEATHTAALAAGHGSSLLKQKEDGKFEMNVGNLPAGKKIVIRITYIQKLDAVISKSVTGIQRLTLPTTITPPYIPDRAKNDLQAMIETTPAPSKSESYGFTINMKIRMLHKLLAIKSPSRHAINWVIDPNNDKLATVTLAGQAATLDRDFLIDLNTEQYAVNPGRFCTMEAFQDPSSDFVGVEATFRPVYDATTRKWIIDLPTVSAASAVSTISAVCSVSAASSVAAIDSKADGERKNIQLQIYCDASASLTGDAATRVQEAIQYIQKEKKFPAGAVVNAYEFGSDARLVFTNDQVPPPAFIGFETVEDVSVKDGKEYYESVLTKVKAEKRIGGGTQFLRLLKTAAKSATKENPVQIMLITDGDLAQEIDEIIDFLKDKKETIELYIIGVGYTIERGILRKLARTVSTSSIEFCYPTESLNDKIDRHVNRMSCGLRQISMKWGQITNQYGEVDSSIPLTSMVSRSCISSGEDVSTYALLKRGQKSTVTIKAISWTGMRYEWKLPVNIASSTIIRGHVLSRLAGHHVIPNLQDAKDIVKVATTLNLASKETSFVAVEIRNGKEQQLTHDALAAKKQIEVQPQATKRVDTQLQTVVSGLGNELQQAAEALQREAEEAADDKAQSKCMSAPMSTPSTANPVSKTKAAAAYQQALSPMTPHLFPLQTRSDIPVEWPEVEAAINSKPLASIVLPAFDHNKTFNPDFSLDPTVLRFVGPGESTLSQAVCAIEGLARTMATDSKSPLSDVAKHLLNFLAADSLLRGWLHAQHYIHNPELYIKRIQASLKGEDVQPSKAAAIKGSIDDLQMKGIRLQRRLCQRIDWLLELQRKANVQFNAEFYIKVIAADRAWAEDASSFMKEGETEVSQIETKNPQEFHAFRELQRKGIQWPHSPALRTEIERAGFVFRPMMFNRDHCICETCGVEVSGWRPWHNPWSFHNYAKHPPSFQPGVAVTLPPTSPFVVQMITESNMGRGVSATK